MRRVMLSLAVVFGLMFTSSGAAIAAPEAPLPTVTGVVTKLVDGVVMLKLELKEEQREHLSRLPQVQNGFPTTPGGVGIVKGDVFIRYMLAPSKQLDKEIEQRMGQKVTLELDRSLRVQRLVNGP